MKSKFQKQQEALVRKRNTFMTTVIPYWISHQPGGGMYEHELKIHGQEAAQKLASNAEWYLVKMAKEAEVDRYGNPLSIYERGVKTAFSARALIELYPKHYGDNKKYHLAAEVALA